MACKMMSSRLAVVAELIATESPSQLSPVVIQSTCAVTASVSFCFAYALANADIPSPLALSTNPRQRVADQLVHHPLPAKARFHQHHSGRLGADLANLRRQLASRHVAHRVEGTVGGARRH